MAIAPHAINSVDVDFIIDGTKQHNKIMKESGGIVILILFLKYW